MPDNSSAVREIAASLSIDDWPAFLGAASNHGLLGVISRELHPAALPDTVRDALIYRQTILSALQDAAIRSFVAVVSALQRAGITVCALKGPALSARFYGDPAVRTSIDLDFLIAPGDLTRAVALMNELGYLGKSDASVAYILRHGHHLHFAKPGGTSVELHFEAYVGFGMTLRSAALLDRARSYQFNDQLTVLVPSAEDEFLYLAAHAAGHSYARLLWLYDLKLLVHANPRLDWDVIADRARAANLSVAVGFTMRLLTEWLEVPLTDYVSSDSRSGFRVGVADWMLPFASRATTPSTFDNFKGLVFTAMLCDRPRSSAWLLQHHALRSLRRRAQRLAPALLPPSWAG
jgi:hypothetical protein